MFRRCLCGVSAVIVFGLCCAVPASAYSDAPPVNAPFYGGVYISGRTRELGSVTAYIPVNYRSGYLGMTSGGNLFNSSSSSIAGIIYAGNTEYTFRISSWAEPQYRALNSGSTYYDLTFTSIDYSNAEIMDQFPPKVPAEDILQYVPIVFMGVIVLCLFMKRF